MRLEYYSGTEAFGNDVLEPLLRHEEQNNLLISFARNDRKAETSGWLLATVKDDAGSVLLTAACTPPFNLVLAETDNRPCPAAVKLLAELSRGVESIRKEGGLTLDAAFAGLED